MGVSETALLDADIEPMRWMPTSSVTRPTPTAQSLKE